ncbi:MAG: nitroreductase family protein [Candidatus Hydrogenedentes bacterium]|nr:nitroreductase family protein [Candidatus Hydrogenedentota bacterium]
MDAIQALKTRRSVRDFKTTPIPKNVIEDIIDCARLAPSAMNQQVWHFVVVTDAEMRRRLAHTCEHGAHVGVAPVCVLVFCKDTNYYLEDGCAATENILIATHAKGLASCWVAGEGKPYANQIREMVGVPAGNKLVSIVPIGYAALVPTPDKTPLSQVLHWERY